MNHIDRLLVALDGAVERTLGGRDVGILFSGGIDSCVIAALAKRHCRASLYTIGMKGSHDLTVAESTASRLGMDWKGIVLSEKDVVDSVRGLRKMIEGIGPLAISFEMPLHVVARHADEDVLASGQGADELFGGYARYERMEQAGLREEMRKDVTALISSGSPMERRIASSFEKTMVHPFLDPKVLEVALELPTDLIINGHERKVALREVARSLDLVEEAERKKKAAQYGSGVMRAMKSMAKSQGKDLRAWVEDVGREVI